MTDHTAELCPQCGLCCDGTLFADVELRAADNPKKLTALGLDILQKTKSKLAFHQPCGCFADGLCKIYSERPRQCRAFVCGVLKRTNDGEITRAAALGKIARAKKQIAEIKALLPQEDARALSDRYAEAMSAPIELSDRLAVKKHRQLHLAYDRLMNFLLREFLR